MQCVVSVEEAKKLRCCVQTRAGFWKKQQVCFFLWECWSVHGEVSHPLTGAANKSGRNGAIKLSLEDPDMLNNEEPVNLMFRTSLELLMKPSYDWIQRRNYEEIITHQCARHQSTSGF